MKENSKKVPDAPDILFVCPFHTGLTSGLIDEDGNLHEGYPVWHGMENRVSADDEEYINLNHAWHKQSEMPDFMDETIVVADKDYMNPKIINLGITKKILSKRGPSMKQQQLWNFIASKVDFVYWTYYTFFIPSIK